VMLGYRDLPPCVSLSQNSHVFLFVLDISIKVITFFTNGLCYQLPTNFQLFYE